MQVHNILGVGLLSTFLSFIPYSMLLLPLSLIWNYDVRIFTLNKKEDCIKLQDKMNLCTHSTDAKGYGYSVGFWYFLHLDVKSTFDGTSYSAWILCSRKQFDELMKTEKKESDSELQIKIHVPREEFFVLEKSTGTYSNTYYRRRTLERYSITPTPAQKAILDSEIKIFEEKKSAVFFISGASGRGKSMTAVFLAKILNGLYCEDCTPWEPGDSIQSLYMDFEDIIRKEKKPLVVCFDEVDAVLEKIQKNTIPNNETVQTSVRDKCGWNKLFSKVERGLYPYLIIILTSNRSPEQVTQMMGNDGSFIRKGRVDRFFSM
jgi:hypothetical protein